MPNTSRREFLSMATRMAALMGLSGSMVGKLAEAAEQLATGNAPVIWLQGQACSGCSVSFLNAARPGPLELLTRHISLKYHQTVSTATGKTAMDVVDRWTASGGFHLVVEGSIPAAMPEACVVGGKAFGDQVAAAASSASAVVAVGACAAFGGIPAAEQNPCGATAVGPYLAGRGIGTPVINIPGCPSHPDWVVGTLVHVLGFGVPELDEHGRPKMFFGKLLHDQCPRFADYEREHFARSFDGEGCLFKLGCLGPNTHADCTLRLWNEGTSSCIHSGGSCIACASPDFARRVGCPMHRMTENNRGTDHGDPRS